MVSKKMNIRPMMIPPSPDENIRNAWENVVLKGLPPGHRVRPEILKSWLKCREIGLDPLSNNSPLTLSKTGLLNLIKKHRDLIEVSRPVMQMVEISVRDTGFIVTLSNNDGYVLLVRGDREIFKMAEQNYYLPGCLRTIEHAGTNAIGVCLEEEKPIQITGAEHYNIHHHPWTCSSAPIHNSEGKITGAITLSGRSVGRHQHTLALVTAAAETIESQLRERDLIEEKQQLNSMLTLIFNAFTDGVIAVDKDLKIIRHNSTAAEMLGLNKGLATGLHLNQAVRPEEALIRALETRKYFRGREIGFNSPAGHRSYICSVDPVRNASGHILGAIITMAEKRQVINIAKRIGGNYAKYDFKDIKGNNPALQGRIELAKIAAKTNSRVLLIGESGTGKELFAQAIHNFSSRRNEPFVAVSCGAIPRNLIESELFGSRGGAFTGARRDGQMGKFELANKGTLFLDDVNGLPLDLQTKLLRVLQQNEIMRLGDNRTIPVDVRVISASNTEMIREVENATFREDLYYRIGVVEIAIPPLRDRMDDLELLIDHIMQRQCQEMGIKKPRISDKVFEVLKRYHWPGNIRELENCIERALIISQGSVIRKIHLPERTLKKSGDMEQGAMSLRQGFKGMIEATLNRCDGNMSMAARELKIARSTLYRKMKEFGLS